MNTLAGLLSKIDPDTVYMSHPDERHADHRAAALLAIEALRRLLAAGRLSSGSYHPRGPVLRGE